MKKYIVVFIVSSVVMAVAVYASSIAHPSVISHIKQGKQVDFNERQKSPTFTANSIIVDNIREPKPKLLSKKRWYLSLKYNLP